MSANAPSTPLVVSVTVTMDAPSFSPGSVVSANITLLAKQNRPLPSSRSAAIPDRPRPTLSHSASTTSSTLASFPQSDTVLVDYVVTELSGRWTTDRSWLVPHAHPTAKPSIHLDNHAQAPFAPSSSRAAHAPSPDPTLGPYPWSPALADANAVGGGGRPGHSGVIFRSQPLIVCEHEQVPAGSQVSFAVNAVLPDSLPPTLRGSAMRYAYALVVVVKFPDAQVPHVVRIPFRVLPTYLSSVDHHRTVQRPIPVPTPRNVGPRPNRFLQHDDATALRLSSQLLKSTPPEDIEIALALSMNGRLTAYNSDAGYKPFVDDAGTPLIALSSVPPLQKMASGEFDSYSSVAEGLRVYSVSRGADAVARVYLAKRVHHLGDCVSVMFHFHGDSPCYRLGARLEVQEVIHSKYALGHEQSVSATATALAMASTAAADAAGDSFSPGFSTPKYVDGNGDIDDAGDGDGEVFRKVFGEHGEVVTCARNTEVTFSIPHDAPASFTTGVVTVRWLIHFVFVIPQASKEKVESKENGGENLRLDGDVGDGQDGSQEEEELMDGEREEAETNLAAGFEADGWSGSEWNGDDSRDSKMHPSREVDVLRWTLPIVVSGQPGSQWGDRNVNRITYVSMASS